MSFCRSLSWWYARCQVSRYCQVPIANIGDVGASGWGADGGGSGGPKGSAAAAAAGASAASQLQAQAALLGDLGGGGPLQAASVSAAASEDAESLAAASADAALFTWMADLFFARMLAYNGHVLWLSTHAVPDLGRGQGGTGSWHGVTPSAVALSLALAPSAGGGASRAGEWDGTTGAAGAGGGGASSSSSSFSGSGVAELFGAPTMLVAPSPNPLVSWPGAYRCVCVELLLSGLEVNTVLNSGFLLGGSGGGGDDDATDLLSAYELQQVRAATAAAAASAMPVSLVSLLGERARPPSRPLALPCPALPPAG